jgi:hypothetical protein
MVNPYLKRCFLPQDVTLEHGPDEEIFFVLWPCALAVGGYLTFRFLRSPYLSIERTGGLHKVSFLP